jgi:hypothetical protein
MGNHQTTLSRRHAVVLAATVAVLPGPAFAVLATEPAAAIPTDHDPVHGLIRAHATARAEYARLSEVVKNLEAQVPANAELFIYEDPAALKAFGRRRRERILRGDAWSTASGHDAAVYESNAAVGRMEELLELAIVTTFPATTIGLVMVLEFLARRHADRYFDLDASATAFERADRDLFGHLSRCLRQLTEEAS